MDPAQNQQNPVPPSETPPQPEVTPAGLSQSEPSQTIPQEPILQPQGQVISENVQQPKSGSKLKLFLLLFIIFLILTLAGGAGLTYAVAYEKIKLDKYPDLQRKVSHFVMNLSFMPKTPKYILEKSGLVHQSVTKQSFDISMAIDSADLLSELGLSNLDVQAKGGVDYSDPKNLKIVLSSSITKDFNFELKKNDKTLYFKINKVPSFLFAFLGINTANLDPVISKWISYDTTALDTPARMEINEDKTTDPLSEEFLEDNFNKYLDEGILSKIKTESVTEDSLQMYKLSLDADAETIDSFGKKIEEASKKEGGAKLDSALPASEPQKLSEIIKELKWEIYIDKKDYYTRKVVVSLKMEYDQDGFGSNLFIPTTPTNQSSEVSIAFVAKSGDFGKELNIEIPSESMTFEEFTNAISEIMLGVYGDLRSQQLNYNNDALKMNDLHQLSVGLQAYNASCGNGNYPDNLEAIATPECQELVYIPTDPDGSQYFYQVSEDKQSFYLCAVLDNPKPDSETCPDTNYNYAIKSPN